MVKDKLQISFSLDGAKGIVYIESFHERFKEKNRLLFWEQEDLESLRIVVKSQIMYYKYVRKHLALNYKSPMKYFKEKGFKPSLRNKRGSYEGSFPGREN